MLEYSIAEHPWGVLCVLQPWLMCMCVGAFHGTTSDPVLFCKSALDGGWTATVLFMSLNPLSPFPLKALPLVRLCVAASRAHHPERRPGDCDEARDHPGVRPAPRAAGEGRQRLRLLRTGRQVAGRRRSYGDSGDTGRTTFKVQFLPWNIYFVSPIFFLSCIIFVHKILILC